MVNHIITQEVISRIVRLVEVEKMPYATIAERLGYSESAIGDSYRRYLKNGLQSFRRDKNEVSML